MQSSYISKVISGTTLIAGTSIGAGMLGIPLITSLAGFIPAFFITLLVWLFMLGTGLLLLEVTLWLPDGSNFLSISGYFLGHPGRIITGVMFGFLYYCLMVAYFAAGAPLLVDILYIFLGVHIPAFWGYVIFGVLFGSVVAISPKSIDRVNIVLTVAMCVAWVALVYIAGKEVQTDRLLHQKWPSVVVAIPILFSAFGYHNVIPSLCSYLKRDSGALRMSIILGTSIPMIVYVLWQWLIIGIFSETVLSKILTQGKPVTFALEAITHNHSIKILGQLFALFAIVTSTLGVAFSLVDFLGDGFKVSRKGFKRVVLTFFTFFPPLCFAMIYPAIFEEALSVAGGFGEAFLNGILPVALLWIGRYSYHIKGERPLPVGRIILFFLFLFSSFTIVIESLSLLGKL